MDLFGDKVDRKKLEHSAILIAGSIAGIAGWLSIYPFDVLKTRIQQDFNSQHYRGMADCFRKSVARNNGSYQFLFYGLEATIIRAIPVNAVLFYGYEWGLKLFDRYTAN